MIDAAQNSTTSDLQIPANQPVSLNSDGNVANPNVADPSTVAESGSKPSVDLTADPATNSTNATNSTPTNSTTATPSSQPSLTSPSALSAPSVAQTLDQTVPDIPSTNATATPPVATSSADMSNMPITSVADVLVKNGNLTSQQLDQLILEQVNTGKTLEDLIQEKALVNEQVFTQAKAEFNNVDFVNIVETGISPEAINLIDESVARRYKVLPFAADKDTKTLSVAMINPLDLSAIDFIERKTGYKLKVFYATPSQLDQTIAERYSQNLSSDVTQALEETPQVIAQRKQQQNFANLSGQLVRDAPINRIVDTIMDFALKAKASDVHIEPLAEKTRVRYRIDGILSEKLILPKSVHDAVVSRIKILSDLKLDEKRIPQDGRFNYRNQNEEVDLRVSTLPTIHGEKVVMRLLKKEGQAPSLEELGLDGIALKHVREAITVPHGIILITGPTGSGKTTTLYSILHQINTPKVNIMTLEDPVEYQMTGINQVQINPQAGLTFANGLRSFLRQDPNIIMVGEIRDSETAELAIQASLTGHLVFSTLHTSSAAGAIPRLLDMGAEPFLLASTVTLTMAQRVPRKLNQNYKEEYKPAQAVVDDIKKVLGEKLLNSWCKQNNKDPNNLVLYRAKKDRPQNEPEYKGRIGIFEVMPISDNIGKLILDNKPSSELEAVALQEGMLLMKQDGYLKALAGITTVEEILRVAEV